MADRAQVQAIVERHFRVYEARDERVAPGASAHLFFVMVEDLTFDAAMENVQREVKDLDPELLTFMRREGGEDVVIVTPRPPAAPVSNRWNVTLFILTVFTTVTAGAVYWEGYHNAGGDWRWSLFWDPVNLGWGAVTFALPLLLILGLHETAHYVAARRHGLRATLPYFIPVPPVIFPIGTFGAFIRLRDPLPDRKALFDVGASGPLAGFVVAIPILILGAALTGGDAILVPDLDRPEIDAPGFLLDADEPGRFDLRMDDAGAGTYVVAITGPEDDWEVTGTATISVAAGEDREATTLTDAFTTVLDAGETYRFTLQAPEGTESIDVQLEWEDGLVRFGDPLLVRGLDRIFDNSAYLTHPTFFAGWVGMLVTGINLLPAGQLDGGHVARAILGDKVRFASMAALVAILLLSFQFTGWWIMALFLVLTGLQHPPALNERSGLGTGRVVLAAVVILVFALTFIPVPITV